MKILFYAPHVVQYRVDMLKRLSQLVDVKVLFGSKFGLEKGKERGFAVEVDFNVDLTGLDYCFLPTIIDSRGKLGVVNRGIKKLLRNASFDAVVVSGWGTVGHIQFIRAVRAAGIPLILRGEASKLHSYHSSFIEKIRLNMLKRMLRKADALLSIGSLATEFYKDIGIAEERIFLSPYTVDNDSFMCQRERGANPDDFNKLGLDPSGRTVIFSGKFIPRKRPLDLLEAALQVQKKGFPLNVIFMGEGPLRGEMEEYIRVNSVRNVCLTGFIPKLEMHRYYNLADIFVLPSAFDTFGLVVNEAMCFGLPVITTTMVGSGYDLVRQGESGYLYEPGDIAQLSKQIERLISDDAVLRSFSEKSFSIIKKWGLPESVQGIIQAAEYVIK